ncbi:MAG TPA: TonB-dependent receptor, partial [Gemmatimonadaceae bacterium]
MHIRPSLLRFLMAVVLTAPLILGARSAAAQQADVIRGRITGRDGVAISGVRVTVTSVSGNVSRTARTDNNGRFTVIFQGGEGDYFVGLAIIGFAPKRFEVKRAADEEILIADATMSTAVTQLDTVQVGAGRTRPTRGVTAPDISGTEHAVDARNVDPSQQGDLAAMAASIPGVTLVPGADGDPSGFSVLGLSPDQNASTLNGMSYNGSNVPRDAGISTSIVTNPYDVSRGGFAGAQLNVRSQPGSNYITRYTSLNLDAPPLQWTDASGRSLGQQYTNASLGGRVSGPLVFDKAFYNLAFQAGRRASDLHSLISTDALGLQAAGVSLDSVSRLVSILNREAVPLTAPQLGSSRETDQASLFGSFDFAPPSSTRGTAVNVTVSANMIGLSPAGALNTEVPAHGGDRKLAQGALQIGHSTYFGVGILSETQASISTSVNHGDVFTALPSASVLVGSTFADGSSVVRNIGFGGSPFLGTRQSATTGGLMNQLSWFSTNNKHRIKLTTELRNDAYSQDQTANALGSFTFNSLADLDANQPVSFTRQLSRRVRSGSDHIEAVSLGDAYRPSTALQLQYGLRLDANQFNTRPVANPDVARVFGTSNDQVPSHAYVSPRLGFSWAYGTGAQIAAFAGAARGPRAVVRGGIGLFQGVPQSTLIGGALDNTGLPSSIQQVFCVGPATPVPDWSAYVADINNIPTSCGDGTTGTTFANTAPSVTLFDRSYTAPRSVRSNLQWNGAVLNNRFNASFEGVLSINQHQPSFVDLNFNGVEQFGLPGEANRPVYVSPTSVVAGSGAISGTAGRVSPLFSHVTQLRSDLTSQSRQFTLRLAPVGFNTHFSWNVAYILSSVREQTRGFASASGDPRDIAQDRSAMDSRHQFTYSVAYNAFDWVRTTWFGSLRSGTPFTPQVAGDINGDGYSNDRAFIFGQTANADPVATAIHSLITSGPSEVRRCLASQVDRIARRNSCEGPWTSTASLTFAFNP